MNTCFVMMPFGGYFDGYYHNVTRPAVIAAGLNPVRADEIYSTGAIIDDVHRAIVNAGICIADVTGRNPNVSYELGMAHALGKPVILLTQDVHDVPFDYRHLRHIVYDPKQFGWETAFKSALAQTVQEVGRDPSSHKALRALRSDEDRIREHLTNIFLDTSYDLDRTNHLLCDASGATRIRTTWKVLARSAVYHLCHNVVNDIAGKIEVLSVIDKLGARPLQHVVLEQSEKHLSYYYLFKPFKREGQYFEVETEVLADGYIDLERFHETGDTFVSSQAVTGGIRYSSRVDWLYLPKNPRYVALWAEYLSHPDPAMIGQRVHPIDSSDHYLLKLEYRSDMPFQQETAAAIKCHLD